MPWVAAAVVAAGALSSYMGGKAAAKESEAARAQAADFTNKAIAELEKVGIPSVEAQRIALENPELVFNYVPQMEQEFPEIKTAFDKIEADPRLKEQQVAALQGISERADQGLTSQEESEISALRRGTAQQEQARQQSILQNMEQRGIGGSGAELLSRLSSSQGAAQAAAVDTQNQASLIAQRKMEALQQLGSLAGQQQAQEFSQQATQASAADEIARLNQAARYNVQASNVGAQRQASLGKEETKQQLETQRAATANQEQMYNKDLIQQQFQNELDKAQAAANAYTGGAQQALQGGAMAAANKQAMYQGFGQAAQGGAMAYAASKK